MTLTDTTPHIIAVGGVCELNDLNMDWFDTWLYSGSSIDLDLLEYRRNHSYRNPPDGTEFHGRILIGDWKWVRNYTNEEKTRWHMKPVPNEDGPSEFAAIYNRDSMTIQVAWSQWIQMNRPASLCYPYQNELLTDGDWETYSLPPEAYNEQSLAEWSGKITYIGKDKPC